MLQETLQTIERLLVELTDLNTALDKALIVAITDVQGTITFANGKFCEISKYSLEELLGANHRIVNSGHHSKEFFRQMYRTIARGKIWTGQIKNRAKDGSFYWMHTIIVPLLDKHGKPYQYVSFRNEITERKLEEEKLDALISTMPDIVFFQDGDGRWLKANDAATNLFQLDEDVCQGFTSEELIQQYPRCRTLLSPFAESDDLVWSARQTVHEERTIPQTSGVARIYHVTKVPVYHKGGERSGMIVIGRDVTEQKKAEEALRRSETIAAVGQLASGIAHEIRNPLAAIKWSVEVLRKENPKSEQQINLIISELERVDSIVGELLLVAKPHDKQFGVINIHDILQSVVTLMVGHARKSRISIVTDVPESLPLLYCEPHQLKQVFINLIKNAMEAMENGGHILVEAYVDDAHDVHVLVTDEGSGIPQDLLKRLGEPFLTTKEKGTGLGLMVTQKIIEEHNGTLTFHPHEPQGTVAEVLLHSVSSNEPSVPLPGQI